MPVRTGGWTAQPYSECSVESFWSEYGRQRDDVAARHRKQAGPTGPLTSNSIALEDISHLLRAYIELYWLRPETALWRTMDALALRELGLDAVDLDLGCGDGLNSYCLVGGQLPLEIDDFVDVKTVPAATFFSGGADIYDTPASSATVVPPPPHRIRTGLDWKRNLLDKASRLGLYENLIQHDANMPLPLPDSSYRSVFSNAVYWIDRIEVLLAEIARVLAGEGIATVLVPDRTLRNFYIHYRYVVGRNWQWMAALDMGRHSHIRHQYSLAEWDQRIRAAGLRIKDHRSYMTSRVIEISEVGLRPISPVLIKMANLLSPADRVAIKHEWVEYCMELAVPMLTSGWLDDPALPRVFHGFVLERA